MNKSLKIGVGLVLVILINLFFSFFPIRFDITEDKRFTPSEATIQTLAKFDAPVIIDVLLDGSLPPEFAKLQTETVLLLKEFQAENRNIKFHLIDPMADSKNRNETLTSLQQLGLKPASITIEEDGKTTQKVLFPWAMVNHGNRTVKVPLLKNKLGATPEERTNNSVQNLEYAFADAFFKLGIREKKKIAVLKGNGEMEDRYMADFLTEIKAYYNIAAMTMDSVANNPQKVLNQLNTFDLALIAKPTEAFSEEEKYVIDQFVINGGKSLWLQDQVAMELDSLFNENGANVATRNDLNLDDFFFNYGLRINPVLVNDLYNTPIVLATGETTSSQYNPLPWVYHPMVFSKENHPLNTNMEAVRLQFANTIDTLSNANKKIVLLQSSPFSKAEGTPKTISFDILNTLPNQNDYEPTTGLALAVLLEGQFVSTYNNRIKPLDLENPKEKGTNNKMIVIADGDIIRNQLQKGQPLELGYDKWTNNFYGNKEFLINCLNYLLDDTGLINIRNKKVSIPLLDTQKIANSKTKWQILTIALPVALVIIVGVIFHLVRKKRFAT